MFSRSAPAGARAPWPGLLFLFAALSQSACATHEPLNVDAEQHLAAWRDRGSNSEKLNALAAAMRRSDASRPSRYNARDGLSAAEMEVAALLFNPKLRRVRLAAGVPLASAQLAGLWPDPKFRVNVLRIVESVEDPWIVMGGLPLPLPISGRLTVEKAHAAARSRRAAAQVVLAERDLLRELRLARTHWSGVARRRALLIESLEELDAVLAVARSQRQLNRIGAPDLRLLELERVRRVGRIQLLVLESRRLELRLRQLIGLTPEAPIELVTDASWPVAEPGRPGDRASALAASPELRVARLGLEVAERSHELEVRRQYPDLTLGPMAGTEEGETRVGFSLMNLTLPLWNRNQRAIAEADARRRVARGRLEEARQTVVAELADAEVACNLARQRREILQTRIFPIVNRQLAELRRLAELGDFEVLVILNALTQTLETRLELVEARVAEAAARIRRSALVEPLRTEGLVTPKERS